MNVVSIMAHADDEMRCLGTMLRCAERGDRLAFITLTDGSHGYVQDPSLPRAKVAAIRDREMRALAADLDGDDASSDDVALQTPSDGFDFGKLRHGRRQVNELQACAAAICSAAFFERPSPSPTTFPSISTDAWKDFA